MDAQGILSSEMFFNK